MILNLILLVIFYLSVPIAIIFFIFYHLGVFLKYEKNLRTKYELKLKGYPYKEIESDDKIFKRLERAMFLSMLQNLLIMSNLIFGITYKKLPQNGIYIYSLFILFNFLNFVMIKKLMFYVNEIKCNTMYEFVLVNDRKICCSNYKEDSLYVYIYKGAHRNKLSKAQILNILELNVNNSKYTECFQEYQSTSWLTQKLNRIRKTEMYQYLIY